VSEPSIPETVVLNERREDTPPRAARGTATWQAPAVIALFLVVAMVAAGVGIALGAGDDDAAVDASAPKVGACRTYDAAAAAAPHETSPALPCSGPHSAQTFAVAVDALPQPTSSGTWTDAQIEDAADTPCGIDAAAATVGVDADEFSQSRLSVAFFMPTAAQAKSGARWIRCDLVVHADANSLATVSGDIPTLAKIDGAFATCVDVSGIRQRTTRCESSPTMYAIVGTTDLGSDAADVDPSEVREDCATVVAEKSKVAEPSIQVVFPTAAEFAQGRTFAACLIRADQWDVDMAAWPAETPLGGAGGTSDDIQSV
jgi:hypothetical protein